MKDEQKAKQLIERQSQAPKKNDDKGEVGKHDARTNITISPHQHIALKVADVEIESKKLLQRLVVDGK